MAKLVQVDEIPSMLDLIYSKMGLPYFFLDQEFDETELRAAVDYYAEVELIADDFYPSLEVEVMIKVKERCAISVVKPKNLQTLRFLLFEYSSRHLYLILHSEKSLIAPVIDIFLPSILESGVAAGLFMDEKKISLIERLCENFVVLVGESCLINFSK
jgi:hypothetical protein